VASRLPESFRKDPGGAQASRRKRFFMNRQDPMACEIRCEAKSPAPLEEKHRMIAEAVVSLFTEKGFHGTSMREIATAVGMSMGNLYHYISSKDDVLYLVYRALYRKWEESSGALGTEEIKDPVERLRALMANMLRVTYQNMELTQMTLRESKFLQKPALKKVLSMESEYIDRFVKTIEEGIRKGIFKPVNAKIMGNFIAYNMFFFPLRSWYFQKTVSFEEVERQIMDFTLDALLRHSEGSKRKRPKKRTQATKKRAKPKRAG
jgi:AcrR family transcriptional regulator